MTLKLSRVVPAYVKTVEFIWCKKDWLEMSQQFRAIRKKSMNPMDTCFWCHHKFADGEMMALASPKKGRNKPLCQTCATVLLGVNHG